MALDLKLRLNGPQLAAYHALFDENGQARRRRTVSTLFGRGVGKTYFAQTCWWLLVALFDGQLRDEAPNPFHGVRITSMCPTLKQWKKINLPGINQALGPRGKWSFLRGRVDRQSGEIHFPGGSRIEPFPATPHHAEHNRGVRTDVLDAEELDDIEATVYDSVAIPFLSEPWSLGIELTRGTPTRGRHGLWFRALQNGRLGEQLRDGTLPVAAALNTDQARAMLSVLGELQPEEWPADLPPDPEQATLELLRNYHSFHATYRDARETVSAVAVARGKADMSPAAFKREWEADPDAGEGLVYAFDERFHVREVPSNFSFAEYLVGVDHGYTDPGVFLLAGVSGSGADAIIWILDEIYQTERVEDWWEDQANSWSAAADPGSVWIRRALSRNQLPFYCDRSRPDRIQAFQDAGIQAVGAENDIASGIDRVANLLAKKWTETSENPYSRLYVRPCCVNTIRELGLYRRKKDPLRPGSFLESPVDRDNHAADALRYLCVSRFGPGSGGKNVEPR